MATGLADVVLPELPALRMEIDEHHQHKDVYTHSLTVLDQAIALEKADPDAESPDLVCGWPRCCTTSASRPPAGTSRVGGSPSTTTRWSARSWSASGSRRCATPRSHRGVARLTFLHLRFHGYGGGEWTDSAVRRYVTDAGDLLPRLHKLVRSDSTTRNRKRAAALSATYDSLEARIAELSAKEDLARGAARPRRQRDHGAPRRRPGPEVGRAWRFLKELRLERGPLDRDEAERELLAWWAAQG